MNAIRRAFGMLSVHERAQREKTEVSQDIFFEERKLLATRHRLRFLRERKRDLESALATSGEPPRVAA